MQDDQRQPSVPLGTVQSQWGQRDEGNFGYRSDEDRKAKRGLEDWELVEKIPESQKAVPYWFFAIVAVVALVGIGLSFPFWGLRPGDNRPWLDWGFLIAIVYMGVAGSFVWFMVRLYGSFRAGRLDSDPANENRGNENRANKPSDDAG